MANEPYRLTQTGAEVQADLNDIEALGLATEETAGKMSAADKQKLDGIDPDEYLTSEEVQDVDPVINPSLYYKKTETDALLAQKQATLVSGENIKTINGQSLLGSGNISISGGGGGGGDVNVIETVKVNGTALVPDANKAVDVPVPTTLAELGDDSTHRLVTDTEKTAWGAKYDKPSTGIPASDIESGVIPVVPTALSSFTDDLGSNPTHTHSQYLTSHQDITGKADKPTIVTNGGTTQQLANNTEYRYLSATPSLTVTAPSSIPDDYIAWLVFVSGTTATVFNGPSTWKWSGDNVSNNTFTPAANKTYNVAVWYDGVNVNAKVYGV